MNRTAIRIATTLSLAITCARTAGAQQADLILTNARVYTADRAHPRAQAVAIEGDRIMFVGSTREAETLRGPATRVIDLQGKTLIPGMIDAHGHLTGLGSALRDVDLVGTRSYQEIIDRVVARAKEVRPGAWVRGQGWDQNDWAVTDFPTHDALSRAVPDHPVVLDRIDGHAILANAKAMQLAGVTRNTRDPEGGRILRDARGNPTGVFVDNAMALVARAVPAPTTAEQREGVRLAMRELNRFGLTGIGDAGVDCATIRLYEDMAKAHELTARNYVMVSAGGACMDSILKIGPRDNVDGNYMISLRAVKAYADGALGSRGAKLLEPYSDEPGHTGLMVTPKEELQEIAVKALKAGFQLNIHAIGDGANRAVLDVYEAALNKVPRADHRFRIEHAQVLSPGDIPRFAELGVIPSMQAVHQTSDMYWAEKRLGPKRVLGAYAWRSLLDTGVIIAGGSDFPVESPDPLQSFHAAVSRQDAKNWPPGGWQPQERMTRAEALNHLTIWAAYASFQEKRTGSITPGKLADLTVLSQDIMTVPAEDILKTKVQLTIVGGNIVYDANASAANELQVVPLETHSAIGMRGVSVPRANVVWASGTSGTVLRSIDGGSTWEAHEIPGADSLDFRDIEAFDENTAVVLSAGEDGRIYRTRDGGKTWQLQFRNSVKGAFFDCIDFTDAQHGIAMSDPVDGHFLLMRTEDGEHWSRIDDARMPAILDGEAAFAASGTCILTPGGSQVYLSTGGGAQARVFVSTDRGTSWIATSTPIEAGVGSAGIFTLAFRDANTGVALGGDYVRPEAAGVVAYTGDGGRSWKAVGHTEYVSGAAFMPNSNTVVAVGTKGTRVSHDAGATWTSVDPVEYNAVQFAADGTGYAVGPRGRIAKIVKR